jgi:hypothetical protein
MKLTAHASGFALALSLGSGTAAAQAPAPAAPPPVPAQPAAAPPAAEPAAPPLADPAPAEVPPAPPPPPVPVAPPPAPAPAGPVAPPPAYPEADEQPEPDDGTFGSHQQNLFFGAGVRTNFITSEGYDVFSEDDALPQFSLHAGAVTLTSGELSLAVLGGWDYGQTQSNALGAATELDVHRLWLGAEGRYHVWRRFYAYGRLVPALLHSAASLRDNVAQAERESESWLFGVDLSLGAAYELFGQNRGASKSARGWLAVAGGYGFVSGSDLVLEVEEGGMAPIRTAALDLGELALSSPFVRVDFTLSF